MQKHILITGSTDGIGKLAAIKLAKEGHQIYLHGRSADKLAQVIAEVQEVSKNQQVKGFVADFSDLNSVKQMGQKIAGELSQLDVLINNAGVFKSSDIHSKVGLDMRIVVNYLAPYTLTTQLLPLLAKGLNTRIINLSSAAQAKVSHRVLIGKETQSTQETYAQSKLALTMWSFHLANTLSGISVIAVNPGSLLNTKMVQEAYGQHWSSADKGADILYQLAISTDYEGITGKYFDNDRGGFGKAHQDAYDSVAIQNLINTTEEVLSNNG
ncbi:MAG TPA: short-chain dehydrogenase [Microscillaceae bacterium]|nr:short-chain dehydrogenase [Microscillaceae bacterium]